MQTDYNQISHEYKKAKQHPWRIHVELYTIFQLIGDPAGKSVLDLACGEGFLTREVKRRGAGRVVGVDLSEKMVELGRQQEAASPLGIEYVCCNAKALALPEKFDLVIAGYLLNYAETRAELLEYCQAIARHLKPGGRFVTVNNNPAVQHFPDGKRYGFDKYYEGELREGLPIFWKIHLDDCSFEIINFHLTPETHEWAFRTAGFREVRWHPPKLEQSELPRLEFWRPFLEQPPIAFLECMM